MKDYRIYVDGELATAAFELGFPEELCELVDETNGIRKNPDASQVVNWLREEKNIEISISKNSPMADYDYNAYTCRTDRFEYGKVNQWYDYESVLLMAIKSAFNMLKEQ